jgi:hypothetical protein
LLSIIDVERAKTQLPPPTQAATAAWLRMQGIRFSDSLFRRLWATLEGREVKRVQRKDKLTKLRPVPAPAPEIGEVAPAPEPLPQSSKPLFGGKLRSPDAFRPKLEGKRFVFTCAQNNTLLHDDFWSSLLHFCEQTGAQLGVSRITYNKNGWAFHGGRSKKMSDEDKELWYDDRILDYIADDQVKIADDLVFCGELDILPTVAYPLTGLDNYTGRHSAIVPHTKMQLQSLATMKAAPAKMLYSTGAVTLRNYIQRKTGQVASYHHVYGAMYVEVDDNGQWFARQINADENGMFFDLDMAYGPGWHAPASEFGQPTVNLGDVHVEKLDEVAMDGAADMLRVLNPTAIMLHDLIDFEARNHHNKKDPLFLAQMHYSNTERVESAFLRAYDFVLGLHQAHPTATIYGIRSNHDTAFKKWLVESTGFPDAPNLEFWHRANARLHKAIAERDYKFDIYAWAFREQDKNFLLGIDDMLTFIQEDQSLVINGIEYGMHGHLGPNGARGNPKAFRQIGRRANTGHTHSASIIDGVWTAGLLANLDMGYNIGPSSWSQSHIITHPNGKRQIVTQRGNKWRA